MSEKTSSGFNLTLKNNEESRLQQIFQTFTNDTGHMKLSDFIILCLTKQFVTNATPIHMILSSFLQAAGEKGYLNKDRFFFAINLLSRVLYPDEIVPLELTITRLLTEYANESDYVLPLIDDKLLNLLNEGIIRLFEKAEEGFFSLLMSYNLQNISNGRKIVGIQQIKSKNLGILARNLIKFCKSRELFPALMSIEDFCKCIEEVAPPKDKDSRKFFSYGYLIKFYEKECKNDALASIEPIKGEPMIRLLELQLIFGRMGLTCFPMIDELTEQIQELFEGKLLLYSCPQIKVKYSFDLKSDSSLSDVEDHKKILQEYYHKRIVGSPNKKDKLDISEIVTTTPHIPTLEEIEKMLDDDRAPSFPSQVQVVQENPPPYTLPPIQYPLAKTSQGAEKRESPKKEQKNRSETPALKIKFAPMPGRFTSSTPERPRYESFAEMRKNINGSLYPETAKQMLANPAIQPCLIREVFMPPTAPVLASSLIESCFAYQSNSKYNEALTTLAKAKNR